MAPIFTFAQLYLESDHAHDLAHSALPDAPVRRAQEPKKTRPAWFHRNLGSLRHPQRARVDARLHSRPAG